MEAMTKAAKCTSCAYFLGSILESAKSVKASAGGRPNTGSSQLIAGSEVPCGARRRV